MQLAERSTLLGCAAFHRGAVFLLEPTACPDVVGVSGGT